MSDYYELLGLKRDATAEEVRAAFRLASKDLHPDRNPASEAAEQYKLVVEAFEILSNEEARQAYDDALQGRVRRGVTLKDILQGVGSVAGIFMEAVARSQVMKGGHFQKTIPGIVRDGSCPLCSGTGTLTIDLKIVQLTKECATCSGTGAVYAPVPMKEDR